MPIRQRIKRAFTRSSDSSTASSLTAVSSRNDSSIFQPGEPMPRLKYRAPVDRKHKELLESFTFPQTFNRSLSRKNSAMSLVSPGGTRMPSRSNSLSGPAHTRRHALHQDADEDAIRATSIFYAGPKDSSSDEDSPEGSISKEKAVLAGTAKDHTMFSGNDFVLAIERNRLGAANPLVAV